MEVTTLSIQAVIYLITAVIFVYALKNKTEKNKDAIHSQKELIDKDILKHDKDIELIFTKISELRGELADKIGSVEMMELNGRIEKQIDKLEKKIDKLIENQK